MRREWTDPDRGKVPFGPYATTWIAERPGLRPRTVYLYQWTLAKHLAPSFGRVFLSEIDPAIRPDRPRCRLNAVALGVQGRQLRDRVQLQSAPAKVVKSSSTSVPLTVTTTLGCSPAALR